MTQYESIVDASETWLEKWLLHEANEVYNYYSCVEYESNKRIKAIWERFLDYELGQLAHVRGLFEKIERRDAAEVLDAKLPAPIAYESHREFVRDVLRREVGLTAKGELFVPMSQETATSPSVLYRDQLNSQGSPSTMVSAGYAWAPGSELSAKPPMAGRSVPQSRSDLS